MIGRATLWATRIVAALLLLGAAAQAAMAVPCAEVGTALLAAVPGSTVAVEGACVGGLRLPARDYGGVVLDMRQATVPDGALLMGIKGLSIRGGVWGRDDAPLPAVHTIVASRMEDFSLAEATVLGNPGGRRNGLSISDSRRVTVRGVRFVGLVTGMGVRSSADVLVTGNLAVGSAADGFNITDVQGAVVSENECRDFTPGVGAHPDCIQFRSLAGRPKQRDIWVVNNLCVGDAQCFFGAEAGTYFLGNYAAPRRFTHTVSATSCSDCAAFDNVLSNTPDSPNGAGSLKMGAGSVADRNIVWDARSKGWAPRIRVFVKVPMMGSLFDRGAGETVP